MATEEQYKLARAFAAHIRDRDRAAGVLERFDDRAGV